MNGSVESLCRLFHLFQVVLLSKAIHTSESEATDRCLVASGRALEFDTIHTM